MERDWLQTRMIYVGLTAEARQHIGEVEERACTGLSLGMSYISFETALILPASSLERPQPLAGHNA